MKSKMKIFYSYKEAQKDYEDEVLSLSPSERLSITEYLRRQYFLIKKRPIDLRVKRVIEIEKIEA